ncbi:hypothetical protein BD779DRAFT_692653 [Infundibulicybe gibba]|nr:hypothetical protein BD779DRAFT_692653 [Infundibulicybe gibba]
MRTPVFDLKGKGRRWALGIVVSGTRSWRSVSRYLVGTNFPLPSGATPAHILHINAIQTPTCGRTVHVVVSAKQTRLKPANSILAFDLIIFNVYPLPRALQLSQPSSHFCLPLSRLAIRIRPAPLHPFYHPYRLLPSPAWLAFHYLFQLGNLLDDRGPTPSGPKFPRRFSSRSV